MKKILIRTMGGKDIGYGHFYRCLSLNKAISLKDKSCKVIFIINDELENLVKDTEYEYIISNDFNEDIDIIQRLGDVYLYILDSYLVNNEFLKNIKKNTKLMLIDDNKDIYDSTIPDILYNGNIHAKELSYIDQEQQLQLLGSEYLIMKEEYWNNIEEQQSNNNNNKNNKNNILITTGGSDNNEVMYNIINELRDINLPIKLIIGPGYTDEYTKKIENIKTDNMELIYSPKSLKEYILASKVVVSTGSSTVYEVLSQKSIPIIYSVADNQDMICDMLIKYGIDYIGKCPNIDYKGLSKILESNYNKDIMGDEQIFKLVTGEGALKVAEEILKI